MIFKLLHQTGLSTFMYWLLVVITVPVVILLQRLLTQIIVSHTCRNFASDGGLWPILCKVRTGKQKGAKYTSAGLLIKILPGSDNFGNCG
jgi:hypothetical protein